MTAPTGLETITDLDDLQLPWNKQLKVQRIDFDGGVKLLRLRVREGKRFTIFDIDPDSAAALAAYFTEFTKTD